MDMSGEEQVAVPDEASKTAPGTEEGGDDAEPEVEPEILEFITWAGPRWQQLRELCPQEFHHVYLSRRGGLNQEEFINQVTMLGFKGDAKRVYEVISYDHNTKTCSDTIQLRQILQFQRDYEPPDAAQNLVDDFRKVLRAKHKCIVRAWRLDLDKHGKGKISYKEIAECCRNLGFRVNNIKLLWQALKHGTKTDGQTLVTLHDLDELEALNFEAFARIVWDEVGSLEKAWKILDHNNSEMVNLADFKAACKSMGFEGDPKTLFYGLEISGTGRLGKKNFDYLAQWAPSTSSRHWTDDELVVHFYKFIDMHFGDPETFFKEIDDGVRGGLNLEEFSVSVRSHGYTGSPHECARLYGLLTENSDTSVSSETLMKLKDQYGEQIAESQNQSQLSPNTRAKRAGMVEKTRMEVLAIVEKLSKTGDGWRQIMDIVDIPRHGAEIPRITVECFLEAMQKLAYRHKCEFNGDPDALASMLGKGDGHLGWVSKRDILLLRKRLNPLPTPKFSPEDRVAMKRDLDKRNEESQHELKERKQWERFVGDATPFNVLLPSNTRMYFSQPVRMKKSTGKRQSLQQWSALSESLRDRPDWNSSVTCTSDANNELSARVRTYFGEMSEKPVKAQILKELARKGGP